MPRRLRKLCSGQPCTSWRSRRRSRWIYWPCTVCVRALSDSARVWPIKSAAFCLSAGSLCGKASCHYAKRCPSSKSDVLSPRMINLIGELIQDWRRLDERIASVSTEIEAMAKRDESCQRLMSVPGVGPIVSSAVVAAIGNGTGFKQGRDFAAWLGLIPKQESTGDRTILGKISKRGNKYVRTLFVQAAHVVLERRPRTARQGLWPW